jgi:phage gp36-like protein
VAIFLTVDQMVTRVGLEEMLQLAGIGNTRDEDGRSLDRPKIEAAIKFADDLVIAKLSARYKTIAAMTPDNTPDLLKGYVEDIARYRLRARSGSQNQVTEEIRKRFDDACAFLKEVQAGKSSLDIIGDPRGDEAHAFGALDAIPEDRSDEILQGYL